MKLKLGVLLLLALGVNADFSMPQPWTWRCESTTPAGSSRCVKEPLNAINSDGMSFTACKLTCGQYGALWPFPKSVRLGKEVSYFLPSSIGKTVLASPADAALTNVAITTFLKNLNQNHPEYLETKDLWKESLNNKLFKHQLKLLVEITGPSQTHLTLNTTDEKYTLRVETIGKLTIARINARTFFGARHGLETLSQLIDYDEERNTLQIVNFVDIMDEPKYPYRGFLLDTSRNFFPIKSIERTLDAMAASKLNTFHWHITDSHSFPMVIESLPNMAYYGAYTPGELYYPNDIRHIVEYGRVRGIRVLPELDAPSHVGFGWQWGPQEGLGELAVCVNQEPWYTYCWEPPCGQLNIANENIYPVLSKIYTEMLEMFGPLDLFHYGGDEVNTHCWNTTQEIVTMMEQQGQNRSAESFYAQWAHFQDKAAQLLTRSNKGVETLGILWTSLLTKNGRAAKYLNRDKYIIQMWYSHDDKYIKELFDNGFRVIFSNSDAWYLDCGFGAWVGEGNNWCSPYKGWQKFYDNNPRTIALNMTQDTADLSLIMGGEACMWSEQVDQYNLDSKVWPRAAAMAERLWSDPDHNWEPAEARMVHHRQRLVKRGVSAERLQPQFCHHNEQMCYARVGPVAEV